VDIYVHMRIGSDLIPIKTRKRFIYFNNNIIITNGPEVMFLRGGARDYDSAAAATTRAFLELLLFPCPPPIPSFRPTPLTRILINYSKPRFI